MVFQFEHVGLDHGARRSGTCRPLRMRDLKASFGRWQAGLADVGWNSLYWDNHDQPRAVSRFGDDSPALPARLRDLPGHAAAPAPRDAVRLPGPGDRHGELPVRRARRLPRRRVGQPLRARRWSPARTRPHVLAALRRMSRDNARTPVQWDDSPSAGFTTGTPWLPVNPDHVEWNAERPARRPESVLAHYRRLIALRHDEPGGGPGRLRDAAARARRRLRVHPLAGRRRAARRLQPQPDAAPAGRAAAAGAGRRAGAGQPAGDDPAVLAPWEARVLRLA